MTLLSQTGDILICPIRVVTVLILIANKFFLSYFGFYRLPFVALLTFVIGHSVSGSERTEINS